MNDWLEAFVFAPALLTLAEASGWELPTGSVDGVLDQFVSLSVDFRSGAERHIVTERPAVVRGRFVDEDLILTAGRELGLVGGMATSGSFSYAIALGGMARACLNRTARMKQLTENVAIRH